MFLSAYTARWFLLLFSLQSGSGDRPWEPQELKLEKVTWEGMVTMTASQPEGVAAEIQQQVTSNLIINCNYIQVFENKWVILWILFTFFLNDINTTHRKMLQPQISFHKLGFLLFLVSHWILKAFKFPQNLQMHHCWNNKLQNTIAAQHVPRPYVVSIGNPAANLLKPLRLPLSDFLLIPSEARWYESLCVHYVLFYNRTGNKCVCLCKGGWDYAYTRACTCVIIVNQ